MSRMSDGARHETRELHPAIGATENAKEILQGTSSTSKTCRNGKSVNELGRLGDGMLHFIAENVG